MTPKILTLTVIATLIILSAGCITNDPILPNTPITPPINITPIPEPIPISTPESPTTPIPKIIPINPIDSLINDLIENNPGNRNYYKTIGNLSELNTNGTMCIATCNYITDNYNYTNGICLLEANQGCHGIARTWVIINDSKYIINQFGNKYWSEENHSIKYGDNYKIKLIPLKKGKEMIRASNEFWHTVNNPD